MIRAVEKDVSVRHLLAHHGDSTEVLKYAVIDMLRVLLIDRDYSRATELRLELRIDDEPGAMWGRSEPAPKPKLRGKTRRIVFTPED